VYVCVIHMCHPIVGTYVCVYYTYVLSDRRYVCMCHQIVGTYVWVYYTHVLSDSRYVIMCVLYICVIRS